MIIKSWEEMIEEFELNMHGDVYIESDKEHFLSSMKGLCGYILNDAEISDIVINGRTSVSQWTITTNMVKPLKIIDTEVSYMHELSQQVLMQVSDIKELIKGISPKEELPSIESVQYKCQMVRDSINEIEKVLIEYYNTKE